MRTMVIVSTLLITGCISVLDICLSPGNDFPQPEPPSPRGSAYGHYLAAMIYERSGQADKAISELSQAWELAPESRTLEKRLVRAYARQNDIDGIIGVFRRVAERSPDNPAAWLALGNAYHDAERYDEAIETYQKALEVAPDDRRPWLLLGRTYRKLERFDNEVAAYCQALLAAPDKISEPLLIEIEESSRDLVALAEFYEQLLALRPDAPLFHFRYGCTLRRMNDENSAEQSFLRVLELDPGLYRTHYQLANIYFDADRNQEAVQQFALYLEELAKDPGLDGEVDKLKETALVHEQLAGAHARMGAYEKALESLAQVIAQPNGEPYHQIEKMYLLLRAGRYEEAAAAERPEEAPALAALLAALALKAEGKPYRPLLGSLRSLDADLDEECREFLEVLLYFYGEQETGTFLLSALTELDSEEGVHAKALRYVRAFTLMRLERYDQAAAAFSDMLDTYGPDTGVHYALAVCNESLDRVSATVAHLKAYLELEPDDPEALNFLGYFYADNDMNLDEAEKLIEKALAADPDNGFYLDSLGWVYYRKGNADKAVQYIRRAIRQMQNDDAILRDHLGDAYKMKGELEKAVDQWRRAQRLDPELEGVKEKIERHDAKTKPNR